MFSNNSSKASEFFQSKENYDNLITPDIESKSIDFWYDVPYFGKIDINGIPVLPREDIEQGVLDNLDSDGKFQALNFVVTAFNALRNFINFAKSKGAFKQDFLGKFNPERAWEPAELLFDQYHEKNIYNVFLNDFIVNKKIYSIDCFIKQYLNFARLTAVDISFTFSNFILSNNCTNRISGLIIDLSTDLHDDTEKKVSDYLNDYQYNSFISACQSHGFNINRNAPWQLVADLSNSTMRKYASAQGINLSKNGLFQSLFSNASSIGYYDFKSLLWQMYADWFRVNTTYSKIKVESRFNSSSPLYSQFETNKINELPVELAPTKDSFFNSYGEINLLKLYLRVRLIELAMEEKYNLLEKHLVEYYNFSGIQGALAFVDKKLTKTNIYTSAVFGEGEDDFNPYFFNDNSLTSEKTPDSIVQNNNQAPPPAQPITGTPGGAPASSGY